MRHFSQFNKAIVNPVKRHGYMGDGRKAMNTLRQVLRDICLRRTKEERKEDLKLVHTHTLFLNKCGFRGNKYDDDKLLKFQNYIKSQKSDKLFTLI